MSETSTFSAEPLSIDGDSNRATHETVSFYLDHPDRPEWERALVRAGFEVLPYDADRPAELVITDRQPLPGVPESRIVRVADGPNAETTEQIIARVARHMERLVAWRTASVGQDPLTGLPVRQALVRRIENEIELSTRIGKPFVLAILDPDGLEEIAAGHGQAAADTSVQAFSRFLRENLRRVDGVGRWGPQETAVVMPATYATAAAHAIERLMDRLRSKPAGGIITFSAGIADFPLAGRDLEQLVDRAERRLLHARRLGNAHIVIHDD